MTDEQVTYQLRLRQEALWLEERLMDAWWNAANEVQAERLRRARDRAERRYWRRHKQLSARNYTPPWFYRDAKGGY
jgi:hypothetical protein